LAEISKIIYLKISGLKKIQKYTPVIGTSGFANGWGGNGMWSQVSGGLFAKKIKRSSKCARC
jgi:hypothetical protein